MHLRRPRRFVPQEHLDRTDVPYPHHDMACEGMRSGMETCGGDAQPFQLAAEFHLKGVYVHLFSVLLGEHPAAPSLHASQQVEDRVVHGDCSLFHPLRLPEVLRPYPYPAVLEVKLLLF